MALNKTTSLLSMFSCDYVALLRSFVRNGAI